MSKRSNAFTSGTFPSPLKWSSIAGATIHASAPMGKAAAAQTASVFRTVYCGISTEIEVSGDANVSSAPIASEISARDHFTFLQ